MSAELSFVLLQYTRVSDIQTDGIAIRKTALQCSAIKTKYYKSGRKTVFCSTIQYRSIYSSRSIFFIQPVKETRTPINDVCIKFLRVI